jgi:hypothetical protein
MFHRPAKARPTPERAADHTRSGRYGNPSRHSAAMAGARAVLHVARKHEASEGQDTQSYNKSAAQLIKRSELRP